MLSDPKLYYIVLVYIAVPILVSWFHINVKKSNSDWHTYISYSLVAVFLSPLILKSVGNDTIQNFLGKDLFEHFQVLAYVTLVGVGGFGLVKKIVSDVFGKEEQERVSNLEAVAKITVEDKITSSNRVAVEKFMKWLSENDGVNSESIPDEHKMAFDEAKRNSLMTYDVVGKKYYLSSIGKIILSK